MPISTASSTSSRASADKQTLETSDTDADIWSASMVAGLVHDPTCHDLVDRILREVVGIIDARLAGNAAGAPGVCAVTGNPLPGLQPFAGTANHHREAPMQSNRPPAFMA